jgi:glutamate--cysteine ligase
LDPRGLDEARYLDPLDAIVADGRAPAQHWIERFEGPWGRSVEPAFREAAI